MFKVIAILSVALVAAISAYDFSDTYYNQFLFEEYEMLNTNTLSRQRRDADDMSGPEAVEEVMALVETIPAEEESPAEETGAGEYAEDPAPEEVVVEPIKTFDVVEAIAPENVAAVYNSRTAEPVETDVAEPEEIPTPVHVETPVHVAPPAPAVESNDKSSHCGGTPNEMKKDITCCDGNKHISAYFAMIRDTKKECAKKLRTNNPDVENFDPFNCRHMEKIKELIICESECVAKTLNMLDEHGSIKREAIIENFKKRLGDMEESKLKNLASYVDKCLNKVKALNLKSNYNKCSQAPMEFQHCMFGEMVVGCPAEHQINTVRCQKIRDRYSKGESLALGRHSLHDILHPVNKRQGK